MAKQTAIQISGADHITLASPRGTTGMRFGGGRLYATSGKQLKLKAAALAEVAEAVAAYRAPRYETDQRVAGMRAKYGTSERAWEAEDEAAAFEMGREPKLIDPGTGTITVMIGREDLA